MEMMDGARDILMHERLYNLTQQLASMEEEIGSLKSELVSLKALAGNIPITRLGGRSGACGRSGGICKRFCAHHKELMEAAVWSNLPSDILQMVFSRMPLTQIIQLQCLSKEWYRTAKESGFRQLCASAAPHLQMLAWVSEDDKEHPELGVFSIKLWDRRSKKWHAFEQRTPHDQHFDTMCACDGGLVCFVSRMKDKVANPLVILVLNPLTREWKNLPPHPPLKKVQPKMVQLVMDRDTKCYRVLVVAENQGPSSRAFSGWVGWVYSSATREWSSAKSMPDLIFGYEFHWQWKGVCRFPSSTGSQAAIPLRGHRVGPRVYDCSKAQLLRLGGTKEDNIFAGSVDDAIVDDRLFVLYHVTDRHRYFADSQIRYYILEFQWHKNGPHWTEEKVHMCTGFEDDELENAKLQACKGFLVLTSDVDAIWGSKGVFSWLYDFSTPKWHKVPFLPNDKDVSRSSIICEVRWDAVP